MTGSLQNRQVWLGGGIVAAILIALAAWFFVINPETSSTSSLQGQTSNADSLNDTIRVKNAKLAKQYAQLDSLKTELSQALIALPADSGLPQFTRELAQAAGDTALELKSITVGGIAAVAASTPTATTTATTTTTTTATTSTVASGQFSITVTVNTTGPLTQQIAFINALRTGARRVLVTSTQLSVGAASRVASVDAGTTMTSQLTIFSAPLTAAQLKQLQTISTGR